MSLGNSLFQARKNCGMSQQDVAQILGVSRQTISKWETDETTPDLAQGKRLAALYRLSLDELTGFDTQLQQLQQAIAGISEEKQQQIDWTAVWAQQYPVLGTYPQQVRIQEYERSLQTLLVRLRQDYGYSELDAMLVLKDILGHMWNHDSSQK
jgi:transcriptional regulator with XRE-family HTH domain